MKPIRFATAASPPSSNNPHTVFQIKTGISGCLIFMLALIVRWVYLREIQYTDAFPLLLGDAQLFDVWAREIAAGNWAGDQVFFNAPLYPYFLAGIYSVFGRDLIFPQPTPTPSGAEVIAEMQDRWQELAPMPAARTGLAATAYDGNIYAIAGEGPAGVSGSVFRYITEENRWESLEDKPTPVRDVEAALIGEKIYVPGGLLGDGAPTNILEIYDPRANQWESGAPLPVKLSAYAMADFEGQLYLFGGWDGQKALDNVFIYDPGTDEWREGTPMAAARYQAEAIPLADKIVVVGGRDNQAILKNADYFYPSRDLREETPWEALSPLPESLTGISVINVYDTLYVIGGDNPDGGSQAASYIFYDDVWSEFGDIQPQVMQSPTLTNVGSFIYLLNPGESSDQTAFWSYKAFSYEIFLPIIQ